MNRLAASFVMGVALLLVVTPWLAVLGAESAPIAPSPAPAAGAVQAELPPPPVPGPGRAPSGGTPVVAREGELESSNLPPLSGRDPFWPVNYVPKKREAPAAVKHGPSPAPAVDVVPESPPDWDEAQKRLDVKGVSHLGRDKTTGKEKYLAVVNGKVVEQGDIVSVTMGGRTYRWRIQAIGSRGVSLVKSSARVE
jgi:hypothetical protein